MYTDRHTKKLMDINFGYKKSQTLFFVYFMSEYYMSEYFISVLIYSTKKCPQKLNVVLVFNWEEIETLV